MKNTTVLGLIVLSTIAFGFGFRVCNKNTSMSSGHTCCSCTSHSSTTTEAHKDIKDITEYPFAAHGSLNIDNTNGGIVIEKHDADTLIVESVKRAQAEHLADIEVVISVNNGVADIKTLYKKSNTNGFVSYAIKVPASTFVQASNVNGSILTGDIKHVAANTVNGSIIANDVERAELETVSGELTASFAGVVKPSSFQSINGNIEVSLPSSYKGSVATSTMNGAVYSDFPRAQNADVSLETMNGSIRVTKIS